MVILCEAWTEIETFCNRITLTGYKRSNLNAPRVLHPLVSFDALVPMAAEMCAIVILKDLTSTIIRAADHRYGYAKETQRLHRPHSEGCLPEIR